MNPSWVCVPTRNIRKDELGRQSTDNQIFSKPPIGFDWILPCFAGEAGRLFLRALLLNGYRNVMWKKKKEAGPSDTMRHRAVDDYSGGGGGKPSRRIIFDRSEP